MGHVVILILESKKNNCAHRNKKFSIDKFYKVEKIRQVNLWASETSIY